MKIVFVGLGGVPFSKRAIDVRLGAFAQLFVECGYTVEIINRFQHIKDMEERPYRVYNPFNSCVPQKKFLKILYYIVALLKEPFVIFKSNRSEQINILYVTSGHFVDIVVYRLLSWLIGAKLVKEYCEARSSFNTRNIYHRINGYLVDYYSPKLWDGAICISHFLNDSCKRVNRNLSTIIVYPLCDFSVFDSCSTETFKYILFCGSLEYREIIDFIVDSYNCSIISKIVELHMVLSGSKESLENFKSENPNIFVDSNLPYKDLIMKYKGALALLIPLRDNIRDIARFPNKTCEYCASKGVVVTTNVGEMSYVFKDGDNALVAERYSKECYVGKLDWIADNMEGLGNIKDRCYKTGRQFFSLDAYLKPISLFVNNVIKL